MQRNEICKHIIRKIRDYLHDPDCLSPHRKENRFVRKRSLSMLQVILFLFYSSKVSMYQNLASIFADIPAFCFPKVSKQAISKARQGIKPSLFADLFNLSVDIFYKTTIHESDGIATVFLLLTVQNWSSRIPSLISAYSARCLLLQAKKNGTLRRLSDPWFMTYWMTT